MATYRFEIPESLAFLNGTARRYKVLHGGRGSAKSWSVARALLARCLATKTRVLCAREYQKSIKESVHQLLTDQIALIGLQDHFDILATEIRAKNGSQIVYTGLHDNTADSIKSFEGVDICWVEEAQTITRRSLQILKPTIRKPGSEIWFTLNPENEDDPVYLDFVAGIVDGETDSSIVRRINWYDNPWFDDVLKAEKDHDYEVDPDTARWIWGGEIRKITDAQVLKGKLEIRPFVPDSLLWDGPYQGLDFGYATDPTALIRCWRWQDCLYIEKEVYGNQIETDYLADLLHEMPNSADYVIRADNSRPETINYLRRQGFKRLTACKKWSGCIEDGVQHLRSYHRIVIDPSCKNIILEGKKWSYKTNRNGDIIPILIPGNDHGWDAVRYALEPMILGKASQTAVDMRPAADPMEIYNPHAGGNSWLL